MAAHFSFEDLEARWRAAEAPSGLVCAIVVRTAPAAHDTPRSVELRPGGGVVGDRWVRGERPNGEAEISLIERRVVAALVGGDLDRFHVPGDNFVVDFDLAKGSLPAGTKLRLGSALVEITAKAHTGCVKFAKRLGVQALRWVNAPEHDGRRLRGCYARVLAAGEVSIGDAIAVIDARAER